MYRIHDILLLPLFMVASSCLTLQLCESRCNGLTREWVNTFHRRWKQRCSRRGKIPRFLQQRLGRAAAPSASCECLLLYHLIIAALTGWTWGCESCSTAAFESTIPERCEKGLWEREKELVLIWITNIDKTHCFSATWGTHTQTQWTNKDNKAHNSVKK